MSTSRGINLKPVKLDASLVELLESNNIVSCGSLEGSQNFLLAMSSGEVFRGNTKLKFSPALLSSVLPESISHQSGHRSSSGFLSAAVAAVGLVSGSTATQPTSRIDVSKIFIVGKSAAIVAANNGDNYFVNSELSNGYLIGGGTGVITAVASLGNSGSCLIGTQSGKVFLLNTTVSKKSGLHASIAALIDSVPLGGCKLIYELPPGAANRVTDIAFHELGCFVSTPISLYSFSLKSGTKIFTSGSAQLVWESPVSFIGSRIRLHGSIPELRPNSPGNDASKAWTQISWLNGSCIITSSISEILSVEESRGSAEIRPLTTLLGGSNVTQNLVGKPIDEVVKKIPILGDFFAVTDYFFIVQFESKMVAISRILPPSQYIHQLATSGGSSTPSYGVLHEAHGTSSELVYSAKRVYSVSIANERTDAWKFFLKRKNFEAAILSVDDNNCASKALIYKAEADSLFSSSGGAVDKVGDLYAKALLTDPGTISPFVNEIIGKLSNDRKNLLKFLLTKLDSIGKDDEDDNVMRVQVSVLFIYIASLFVEEMLKNEKSDDIESMFIQFVSERYHSLDMECIKAVYELLEASGMYAELIMVAETVGDSQKAMRVDMETGNYLGIINRIAASPATMLSHDEEEMLVRIAPVLFRFHPSEFVDLLIKKRKILGPEKFVNSVISFAGALSREHKEHVVRYLEFRLLEDGHLTNHHAESLMNILIELKCSLIGSERCNDESSVMHLLESISGRPDFSPEFCLRVLRQHGLKRSEILLMAINGEFVKATRLALALPDIELAKEVAWRPRGREAQKLCWFEIIDKVEDLNDMIATFRESEVLDVVDLIQILNKRGIDKIDGVIFQEVCEKLKGFDDDGKKLESEIRNYSEALELIRSDLRSSRMNACAVLSHSQKCEICLKLLFNEQFVVFNTCGHCFHSECLKEAMTLRLVNKKSQADIDETVCSSCVLCGENSMLLETLFTPFVDPSLDAAEVDLWTVKAI